MPVMMMVVRYDDSLDIVTVLEESLAASVRPSSEG